MIRKIHTTWRYWADVHPILTFFISVTMVLITVSTLAWLTTPDTPC